MCVCVCVYERECIDICGHECRWWYLCLRPIIKVYLLVACVCECVLVCVCAYSRDSACQRAHVRELKVILMLVLGQHECVWGKCYIIINKLVFSKSCEFADTDLPSPH